jgi:hypothetical protein
VICFHQSTIRSLCLPQRYFHLFVNALESGHHLKAVHSESIPKNKGEKRAVKICQRPPPNSTNTLGKSVCSTRDHVATYDHQSPTCAVRRRHTSSRNLKRSRNFRFSRFFSECYCPLMDDTPGTRRRMFVTRKFFLFSAPNSSACTSAALSTNSEAFEIFHRAVPQRQSTRCIPPIPFFSDQIRQNGRRSLISLQRIATASLEKMFGVR